MCSYQYFIQLGILKEKPIHGALVEFPAEVVLDFF